MVRVSRTYYVLFVAPLVSREVTHPRGWLVRFEVETLGLWQDLEETLASGSIDQRGREARNGRAHIAAWCAEA